MNFLEKTKYAGIVFVVSLIITSLWILIGYPAIENWILDHLLLAFIIFMILYSITVFLVTKDINLTLKNDYLSKARYIIIIALTATAFDIILPPYLISSSGTISAVSGGALFSSDIIFYKLIPTALDSIKLWLVYAFVPSILLTIVVLLSTTKKEVKANVLRGV